MSKEQLKNQPKTFTFKYHKVNDFRTVKIDGIYGGLSIKREINMNFYVEANEIAPSAQHVIQDNETVGPQIQVGNPKLYTSIREIQFAVNFDIQTAKSIVVWLNEKIKEADAQVEKLNKSQKVIVEPTPNLNS